MTTKTVAYQKAYRLDRELGRPRTVPSTVVRKHLDELRALGWSWRGIGDACGLSPTTVHHIGRRNATVRVGTARKILALRPESITTRPNEDGFVPALGTRRRIRALLALGWPHTEMQARSGVRTAVTLNQRGEWVSRTTRDAVVALYDEISMTPGPSARTRGRAAKLGYAPPLAWDDVDLDDPAATPHTETAPRRGGRPAADLDEFLFLIRGGESPDHAATRLGVSLNAIEVQATRKGRHDVLDVIYPGHLQRQAVA